MLHQFIEIFKRQKPQMPAPDFQDTWKQDQYEQQLEQGVRSLQDGKNLRIYDDGRGFELACDIKKHFIQEYSKQLAEKIQINRTSDGYEILHR